MSERAKVERRTLKMQRILVLGQIAYQREDPDEVAWLQQRYEHHLAKLPDYRQSFFAQEFTIVAPARALTEQEGLLALAERAEAEGWRGDV